MLLLAAAGYTITLPLCLAWRGVAWLMAQSAWQTPRKSLQAKPGALSVTGKRAIYGLQAWQSYGKWERCTVIDFRREVNAAGVMEKRTQSQ